MADVAVDTTSTFFGDLEYERMGPVWTTASIGYIFYLTSANDLYYHKTTDGGATWATDTVIEAGSVSCFSIWFDKWTPGDSGTVIHIVWFEAGADDILYNSLDTADDSLSGEIIINASFATGLKSTRTSNYISITKASGGNLYMQAIAFATSEDFQRSTDAGANWTARTTGAEGAVDMFALVPDDLAADSADIAMVFWDTSADELSFKKYDDSANSWGETSISGSMTETNTANGFSVAVRHSDGAILVAAWTQLDNAASDLKFWDIDPATPTITVKTDVITDSDDCYGAAVFIDQNNDDIYVAYVGQDDGAQTWTATVDCHYSKSDDGGGTWGGETTYSVNTADDLRHVSAGHSTPGSAAGLFQPVFYNDDLGDIFVNVTNSLDLTPAAGDTSFPPRHPIRHTTRGALLNR